MAAKQPPEKKPLSYKPMLDDNGNPVVSQFGHVVSARLTKEQEKQIEELAAKGLTITRIAEELFTTPARVKTYLHKPRVAERVALLFLTKTLTAKLDVMENQQAELVGIIVKMESRLSDMQTMIRTVNQNARRQKIGRAQVEKEKRTQREELNRLKRQLWKRTGRKYG